MASHILINGAIWVLVAFCAAATVLPLTKVAHGAVQGLGFVRVQMLGVMGLGLGLSGYVLDGAAQLWSWSILIASALINLFYIAKFTPLWTTQSARPERGFPDLPARTVTIIVSNVKQSNRDYDRFLRLIDSEQADVIVAVETDQSWIDALAPLKSTYPETVEVPLDTGYGMALYSRLPLDQIRVVDRVTDGVPSICAAIRLACGAWVRLYAVHPEPPVPHSDTTGRNSEIVLAGLDAKDDRLPAIVTGDLNDVAWSPTTRSFQRLSGLLDPRVGRGFYATFNAFYPLFRWPLDHLFHDPKFRLVDMRRLPAIGSDHFPMLFSLALTATKGDSTLPPLATPDEVDDARDMIHTAQADDSKPVGTEWEDG